MEIRQYTPDLAEEIAKAYNRQVRKVPYCYSITGEIFRAEVAKRLLQGAKDVPLEWQTEFVAIENNRVQGFIQVGAKPKTTDEREGIIRFFWYEPGHRTTGQALLGAAEQILRERGIRRVLAFHQNYTYGFYQLQYSYLSTHLGHIDALLRLNKYRRTKGEVFMQKLDFDPPEPKPTNPGLRISAQWEKRSTDRADLRIVGYMGEIAIAECTAHGIAEYANEETTKDWFYISWLGINESFREKYLGKYVLERTLLQMRRAGYRHAIISTSANNHVAFVFYTNLGFEVSDWTFGLRKILGD